MTSNVAQQTLQLHALCITGLPPQVLASLIVTISARPPGADSYERIAVFSSLRVHTGSGERLPAALSSVGASLYMSFSWPACKLGSIFVSLVCPIAVYVHTQYSAFQILGRKVAMMVLSHAGTVLPCRNGTPAPCLEYDEMAQSPGACSGSAVVAVQCSAATDAMMVLYAGHGASALHILPEWPRCRPLSVCSGEAVTEAAGQLCRLQGDVRFEVRQSGCARLCVTFGNRPIAPSSAIPPLPICCRFIHRCSKGPRLL